MSGVPSKRANACLGLTWGKAKPPQSTLSILSLYHSRFSAYLRSLRGLKMERRLPCRRTTSILLRLSWCLPQEVKRVEVTCHLMHADFPCACFYTLERGSG